MTEDLQKLEDAQGILSSIDMRRYNGSSNRVAKTAILNARQSLVEARDRVEQRLAR